MNEKIIILDFGSQYTQLIARNVREHQIYCEILPFSSELKIDQSVKGVILSGSPCSVNDAENPSINIDKINSKVPVLGICYGAQLTVKNLGGTIEKSTTREYGRAQLIDIEEDHPLLQDVSSSEVWMSHADTITQLPDGVRVIAKTDSIPIAAFEVENKPNPWYGLQFHPEVTHSQKGKLMIGNFLVSVCGCSQDWTPASYVKETVAEIQELVGKDKVVMALSGGVDSTVAATLIHKAIGEQLTCVFVDNGLLRKNEFGQVLEDYKKLGLNIIGVNAADRFYKQLAGKSDPEEKRKIIGGGFIEIFDEEAKKIGDVSFLGQGTIYPDVIESVSVNGPSVTIKSHHNVGGLPEKMNLKLVEPLRYLFKDEVRKIGKELGLDEGFVQRHPFPGPGLGIRILGEVSAEKAEMLQEADHIFIQGLKDANLYHQVWQAGAMLLPVQSVGVMGDERTYEFTLALRAVTSVDGMTADWAHLPHKFLAKVSNDIINKVQGINRVVYDISSKPPATIEWE
jgi:GMP synthase (glutamine-hydrolysing)